MQRMERSRAARRRQLANLYQAGNEDPLLRRRRPKTRAKQLSRFCPISREREAVRTEKEKTLYGSIAETLQFGQQRAWHYGYQNEPGLSGSTPLAAASRYGARGTLKMVRREVSATRGGTSPQDDASVENFQVDEWAPMLRSATSPSLATTTTPKAWPEAALYPHGAAPKRLQPSPWYDGETTVNYFRAATAGSGMRRVAANHSRTMSVLRRNASLENTAKELALRPASSSDSFAARPATVGGVSGMDVGRNVNGRRLRGRTPKRIDQDSGFLSRMMYFKAPKETLRYGVDVALEARLAKQMEEDGLKWSLLKQILRVITGSQKGLPLQAVAEVAAGFGAIVGTSVLATKSQFIDTITGRHVGFPESELTVLFEFFRTGTGHCSGTSTKAMGGKSGNPSTLSPPQRRSLVKDGQTHGANWTAAVACLRLLAYPKESVLSSILGVFKVFARARSDRLRHGQRLENERRRKEREKETEAERERWKRRRRREEQGLQAPAPADTTNNIFSRTATDHDDVAENNFHEASVGPGIGTCVSLSETVRVFTLVCSNAEERHSVTTTYRHRFRLELQAVMLETRRLHRRKVSDSATVAASSSSNESTKLAPASMHNNGMCSRPNTRVDLTNLASKSAKFSQSLENDVPTGNGHDPAGRRAADAGRGRGVSVEEFTEALMRCPEMIEAFGYQLASRLRHRHRPAWMAPILRAGGAR